MADPLPMRDRHAAFRLVVIDEPDERQRQQQRQQRERILQATLSLLQLHQQQRQQRMTSLRRCRHELALQHPQPLTELVALASQEQQLLAEQQAALETVRRTRQDLYQMQLQMDAVAGRLQQELRLLHELEVAASSRQQAGSQQRTARFMFQEANMPNPRPLQKLQQQAQQMEQQHMQQLREFRAQQQLSLQQAQQQQLQPSIPIIHTQQQPSSRLEPHRGGRGGVQSDIVHTTSTRISRNETAHLLEAEAGGTSAFAAQQDHLQRAFFSGSRSGLEIHEQQLNDETLFRHDDTWLPQTERTMGSDVQWRGLQAASPRTTTAQVHDADYPHLPDGSRAAGSSAYQPAVASRSHVVATSRDVLSGTRPSSDPAASTYVSVTRALSATRGVEASEASPSLPSSRQFRDAARAHPDGVVRAPTQCTKYQRAHRVMQACLYEALCEAYLQFRNRQLSAADYVDIRRALQAFSYSRANMHMSTHNADHSAMERTLLYGTGNVPLSTAVQRRGGAVTTSLSRWIVDMRARGESEVDIDDLLCRVLSSVLRRQPYLFLSNALCGLLQRPEVSNLPRFRARLQVLQRMKEERSEQQRRSEQRKEEQRREEQRREEQRREEQLREWKEQLREWKEQRREEQRREWQQLQQQMQQQQQQMQQQQQRQLQQEEQQRAATLAEDASGTYSTQPNYFFEMVLDQQYREESQRRWVSESTPVRSMHASYAHAPTSMHDLYTQSTPNFLAFHTVSRNYEGSISNWIPDLPTPYAHPASEHVFS